MQSSAHYEFMLINKFGLVTLQKVDNLRSVLLYEIKGILIVCTSEDI